VDFTLTAEQQLVRDTAREFAGRVVRPNAAAWDRAETFPTDAVAELARLGFLGMRIPEEYGGSGTDFLSTAMAIEELARADAGIALTVGAHNGLVPGQILIAGTEEQKQRYLPPLARGEHLAGWAVTEPSAGSDVAGIQTRAVRDGDDWVLSGQKAFCTNGSLAGLYLIAARMEENGGHRGLTAFLLERDTAGFTAQKMTGKLGFRSSDTSMLYLDEVRVPDAQRLGAVGGAFYDVMQVLDRARVGFAAIGVGVAQECLDQSVSYAKQRHAFGAPIAQHQSIQWMLADMATNIDAARLLLYRAAYCADIGQRFVQEASMAKLMAAEVGLDCAGKAVQIHGGYGYMNEYPVEKLFRDARFLSIGEGTSEIQRVVIAREYLGLRSQRHEPVAAG